ncbi:pentatricopeptide repeat-containing protein At1g09900-like [Selaginella moellendorffii]|uniref:pentatricopeptide repeat-containing protein At1g09900-like n=1 Tax=Selaginella moellendorffii TaxID=88036 RepID=UPI000D1C9890|nr:pentatricopeptide repeat-containing protein At1g09900-like [Selaginella moellendorffii]|eukprot:XP_024528111.1 pentatricopeptide repeat-containing protein At1g09900-like [Selaginella moellendorffii]
MASAKDSILPAMTNLSTEATAILECLASPELLAKKSMPVNYRVYNEVVLALHDSDKALAFFDWITSGQSRFKHTGYTIRLMTETMNRMNRREESKALFQLWKKQAFPALAVKYSERGNLRATIELLKDMAENGSTLSIQDLNGCLRGLCKAGNVDGALEFFREAKNSFSLRASVSTYSILVAALTAAKRNNDVYEILREVRGTEVKLDLVLRISRVLDEDLDRALESFKELSEEECVEAGGAECFRSLVQGLYQSDRIDEACGLALKLGCESEDVNSLVESLLDRGRVDRARELILAMALRHGSSSVRLHTCNSFLSAVCKNPRNTAEALELLEQMESVGLEADKDTYSLIIHSLCKSGMVDKAKVLVERMISRNCVPDARIYDPVIEELSKTGRVDEAVEIAKEADAKHCTSVVTYNSLVLGFLKARRLKRGIKVFTRMARTGPSPDIYTYNILFEGLSRHGLWRFAYKLLPRMNQDGVLPDAVTFNSLINGLVEDNRYHRAVTLIQEMVSRGCDPNAITYTILLKWLARNARADECVELFQRLLDRKLAPNVYTYNTVMSALCKAGRLDQAHRLFGVMLASDCTPPNAITYRALIHGLCLKMELERAVLLLDAMAKRDCAPDVACYGTIVAAFCKQGRIDEAFELLERMPFAGDKVMFRTLVRALCKLQLRSFSEQISCDEI